MTINDLLMKPYYRHNQSLLAKELGVSRGTVRKYMSDLSGESHIIRKQHGKYVLFALLSTGEK